VLRWARWARAEVQAWPADLSQLDATAQFARTVSAAQHPRDRPMKPDPDQARPIT
jgi:hypothetical protein